MELDTPFIKYTTGLLVYIVLSIILNIVINIVIPELKLNFLEAWGMVMICVAFYAGWNAYHETYQ